MVLKSANISLKRALPDNDPWAVVRHFLFGHPLRTSSQEKESLGFFLGLPILAIDALSSVAYATEEILIALSVAGTSLYGLSIPIAIAIVILLTSVIASYTQTVQAYPDGGGAYTIAKNHLGSTASLVAASSLLIDYILTVSVSVTAGVRAITSSYPALLDKSTSLCVLGILSLAWINLRGIRESAKFVMPFVYAFIACMLMIGGLGLLIPSHQEIGQSLPVATPASLTTHLLDLAMIPIILRAFAGGCTAMTGVEAIANAGSILRRPHAVVAQRILLALGLLLGMMFLSITITAYRLNLTPLENESLLSQVIRALWGGGFIHNATQILIALILFLAANTAFADAPRLSAMLARDGWFPKQLYIIGDRLVFSKGILFLALLASLLVIVFQGQVHALIPLYAIGVFSAFTLSQAGMVLYWRNCWRTGGNHRGSFIIKGMVNGFGAFMTGLALMVTFEAKFAEGAFLILIAVPLIILFCLWIKRHYTATTEQLDVSNSFISSRIRTFAHSQERPIIVPISRLHRGAVEAIAFAREMSRDVRIVIVDIERYNAQQTIIDVEALQWDLKIIVLSSPYRSIIRPIIDYIHSVDKESKKLAVLVLPETVPVHWWENILHNKTSETIVKALSWSETIESQARIIINVPYYLEKR
jgi:amino acid transporter